MKISEVLTAVNTKIVFFIDVIPFFRVEESFFSPEDGGNSSLRRMVYIYQSKWHHIPEYHNLEVEINLHLIF
jgi:hypothetical protein